jgi:hypothetical protein
MLTTTQILTKKAMDRFQADHGDVFSRLSETPAQVFERLSAAVRLDPAASAKFVEYGAKENVDCVEPNFRKARQTMFTDLIYTALAKMFVRVRNNQAIVFTSRLTPEGQLQLAHIEQIASGIVPATPPKPKSAAELLREEVIRSWKELSSDRFRERCRTDVAFRLMYQKLSVASHR